MLGLALVVGSVTLLLGGTLYGINAYLTTVKTTERKLEELKLVNILIETLSRPVRGGPDITAEYSAFKQCHEDTKWQLAYYRTVHAETVARGLDPDGGYQEGKLFVQLDASMAELERALDGTRTQQVVAEAPVPIRNDPKVRQAYENTRLVTENLRSA